MRLSPLLRIPAFVPIGVDNPTTDTPYEMSIDTTSSSTGTNSQTSNGSPNNLFAGLYYSQNAPTTFTLSGLTPDTEYEVAVYAGSSDSGGDTTTVSGSDVAGTDYGGTSRNSYIVTTGLVDGNTVVGEFNSGSGGDLVFTATSAPGASGYAVVNGFSITEASEPATWALLGLGGMAFLAWRPSRRACQCFSFS